MGSILTIASGKGGCGKSSLAMLLTGALVSRGYRLCVIDGDPNKNFSEWHGHNYAEANKVTCLAETDNIEIIERAQASAETADITIIDTAGFQSLTAASAIGVADCVLVPTTADSGSIREAVRTVRQAAAISRASRRPIDVRIVRSIWQASGLAERAASDDLASANVQILKTMIPLMAIIKQMSFSGVIPKAEKIETLSESLLSDLTSLKLIKRKVKHNDRVQA